MIANPELLPPTARAVYELLIRGPLRRDELERCIPRTHRTNNATNGANLLCRAGAAHWVFAGPSGYTPEDVLHLGPSPWSGDSPL